MLDIQAARRLKYGEMRMLSAAARRRNSRSAELPPASAARGACKRGMTRSLPEHCLHRSFKWHCAPNCYSAHCMHVICSIKPLPEDCIHAT